MHHTVFMFYFPCIYTSLKNCLVNLAFVSINFIVDGLECILLLETKLLNVHTIFFSYHTEPYTICPFRVKITLLNRCSHFWFYHVLTCCKAYTVCIYIYIYKQVHIYTYIYTHTKCHVGKDEHTLHQFKKTRTRKFSSRKHMEHGLNHFWIRTTQTPGTPSWTYQIKKKNLIYKTTRSISSQIYQLNVTQNAIILPVLFDVYNIHWVHTIHTRRTENWPKPTPPSCLLKALPKNKPLTWPTRRPMFTHCS